MQTYTLFDLQEFIRRVLALNFQEGIWVTAEIAQLSHSGGHVFVDLVQKGADADNAIVAQAQAVLWQQSYQQLRMSLGTSFEEVLQEGREVRMQVNVDYHERYGLKFVIRDMDPAYTFGKIELQRRKTIETLKEQGLLERNARLSVPKVLQRIAVISSSGAAGFQDFQEQLKQNNFGYAFKCRLFSSAVQGRNLEAQMLAAFQAVTKQAAQFDCVVVLRGGGARLDLSGFDQFDLCKAAAALPLPLFTGIGHDIDETVLDLVAHSALKTPTAVADFLLQHNLFFENQLLRAAEHFREISTHQLAYLSLNLGKLESALEWTVQGQMHSARQDLDALSGRLPGFVQQYVNRANQQLEQAEVLCAALHPDAALQRGFSLTLKAGKVVNSQEDVQKGDVLETRLKDGTVFSKALDQKGKSV